MLDVLVVRMKSFLAKEDRASIIRFGKTSRLMQFKDYSADWVVIWISVKRVWQVVA